MPRKKNLHDTYLRTRVVEVPQDDFSSGNFSTPKRDKFLKFAVNVGAPELAVWVCSANVMVELAFALWHIGLLARKDGGLPVPINDTFEMLAKRYFKNEANPLPCLDATKYCLGECLKSMEGIGFVVLTYVDDLEVYKVSEKYALPLTKFLCRRTENGALVAKRLAVNKDELRDVVADVIKFNK